MEPEPIYEKYVRCDHCDKTVKVESRIKSPSTSILWFDQTIEMDKPNLTYEFHLCPKCRDDLLFSYFFNSKGR